jgi:hypothetical protein
MSNQNNTPPLPEGNVKFQIQALIEMVNFVMGDIWTDLRRWRNMVMKLVQVGADPKSNNDNKVERSRWADRRRFSISKEDNK